MDKTIIMDSTESRFISGLDILKFTMPLFVVAIHSEAVNDIKIVYTITFPIIDSAVPLFFVISAFLFFRKLRQIQRIGSPNKLKILNHFTKRLSLLYCF